MVNVAGREVEKVWCKKKEGLFILRGDEAEAVGVDGMKVLEFMELLVCFGDNGLFLVVGGGTRRSL